MCKYEKRGLAILSVLLLVSSFRGLRPWFQVSEVFDLGFKFQRSSTLVSGFRGLRPWFQVSEVFDLGFKFHHALIHTAAQGSLLDNLSLRQASVHLGLHYIAIFAMIILVPIVISKPKCPK